jgi:hypothetical protein
MAQLFLSQQYLKERSIIDDNVDFQKLTPIIELVQDIYIMPALGTDLFNLIKTQSTPPTSLTAANETLLTDHILKAMVLYVQAEAPISFKFRFMNKGLMIRSAENAQPAETGDLKFYTQEWKSKAELYIQRMTNYILAHQTDYPAYSTNTGLDREPPRTNAFDVDIYLRDMGGNSYLTNDTGPLKDTNSDIGKQIF